MDVTDDDSTRDPVGWLIKNYISLNELRYGLSSDDLANASIDDLDDRLRLVRRMRIDAKFANGEWAKFPRSELADVMDWLRGRERMIESLLQARAQEERLAAVKVEVDKTIPEPEARHDIDAALSEAKAENEKLIRELRDRDDEEARDRKRLENWRTKMEMRIAMVQREPAAVLLGGGLAVAIALVMMVGMFMHTEAPTVLVNAFLLILGFFFGQNTGGGKGASNSG